MSEVSWMFKILNEVKNECNKVRSIQHILSRKQHASVPNTFRNIERIVPEVAKTKVSMVHENIEKLKFGTIFTDHMLKMEFNAENGGWGSPVITPFENISLHPAAKVLQYSTTIFEGMKAYRGVDGKIRMYRPHMNMQRLNQSAERACLPKVDTHLLLRQIEKLIAIDHEYVPCSEKGSLYVRPTIIGSDNTLGVLPVSNAILYVIMTPAGSYFSDNRPVRLYADPKYVRSWPGGCGTVKMGCNYAPALHVQKKAMEKNCQQVLWLFGEDECITEAGTMNLFMYSIDKNGELELATPPLNDIILPGITRDSVMHLAKEFKTCNVVERKITMSELIRLKQEKKLLELFGSGTACTICPVSEIWYKDEILQLPTNNHINPIHKQLKESLFGIQYGKKNHPWVTSVDVLEEVYEMRAAA